LGRGVAVVSFGRGSPQQIDDGLFVLIEFGVARKGGDGRVKLFIRAELVVILVVVEFADEGFAPAPKRRFGGIAARGGLLKEWGYCVPVFFSRRNVS